MKKIFIIIAVVLTIILGVVFLPNAYQRVTASVLPAQLQPFSLSGAGSSIGATTIILSSMKDIDNAVLAMSAFGTKGFGTIEPGSKTREEQISFTGVTQNANGTASLTGVKHVTFITPFTETSGTTKSHPGGAIFVISNTSGFYNSFANTQNTATVTSPWIFSATTTFSTTTISDLTLSSPLSVVSGGTGLATYTTGDMLYATNASTLGVFNDVATGSVLVSGGVGVVPLWGKVSMSSSVYGTLGVANGGTGSATFSQGWLSANGTTITSSTSPTVNYVTATSTTQASTLPYASSTSLTISGSTYLGSITGPLQAIGGLVSATSTIQALYGGTGLSSYSIGDILYANSATTFGKLSDVATGNVLLSGGANTAPSYGKVSLTAAISGILPVINGGTGTTTYKVGYASCYFSATQMGRCSSAVAADGSCTCTGQ
jgi:hypothetical protein